MFRKVSKNMYSIRYSVKVVNVIEKLNQTMILQIITKSPSKTSLSSYYSVCYSDSVDILTTIGTLLN